MISIDVTLLMHIVNMIVLMLVLNAILYKPVLGMLEQRAQRMAKLNGEVAQFELDAQQRQADLDSKIREASSKAKKALDGARAQAQSAGQKRWLPAEKSQTAPRKSNWRILRRRLRPLEKSCRGTWTDLRRQWRARFWGGAWGHEKSY